MEWSDRMNAAIDYIEENLAGEIDTKAAAEIACCSLYHFLRMFFAIIGVTPSEYTRQRRLTLAARELASGNTKVIDVALKYGYNSPVSFARAFRSLHGITPQAARAPGAKLAAFPRISFHVSIKGRSVMDYKIVEKPAFDVLAKTKKTTAVNKENYIILPKFWFDFKASQDYQTVSGLIAAKPGLVTGDSMLGVCIPNEDKNLEEFLYAIGVEKTGKSVPVGFEVIPVPAATWAVFDVQGPAAKSVQDTIDRIYGEWFPSTGYEQAPLPELEVYFPGDTNSPDYRCQVWVPVIKKKHK
jgi:AraC family transcriptional regulator